MDISIRCVVRRKCFEFLSKKLILIKEFLLETSCRRHCNTCVVKGKTVLGWLNLIHGCKVALGITMVYREQHILVGHMALLLLCSLDQKTPFCLQPFCRRWSNNCWNWLTVKIDFSIKIDELQHCWALARACVFLGHISEFFSCSRFAVSLCWSWSCCYLGIES